jgi:hypothetical protein
MNPVILSALLALLIGGPTAAQKPITPPPDPPIPEPTSRMKSSQHAVVVKGCIQNKRLKISQRQADTLEFNVLRATEFILEGPKELMQQLQEQHNRHYDEIDGIVTVPPSPSGATTNVTTKKLGPVTVKSGSREERGLVAEKPRSLTLKVRSLTHLTEGCVPLQ